MNLFSYPNDIIQISDKDLIGKIIYGHDNADLIKRFREANSASVILKPKGKERGHIIIDSPVPQLINGLNLYTTCINGRILVGLVFDEEDNPYDYREIFVDSLHELLNNGDGYSFENDLDIEMLLLSLFIDIRRYGDEIVRKIPEEVLPFEESYVKVFLFGIDEVGKSSLLRRIKTGKFDDNYFIPTRNFNIEYLQKEGDLYAFWDMPGQRAFRKKWVKGIQDSNVIIYIIDVSNQLRFKEAKNELWKILNRYDSAGMPLIILGNKIDLISSSEDLDGQLERTQEELLTFFDLNTLKNREWKFLFTSVKTNHNIDEMLSLISTLVTE